MASIVVLSDIHLSPTHGFFWENWCVAREFANAAKADAAIVNGDLAINGPVDKLVTTGPVNLSNAKLTGFDLGSKMGSLGALAGVSKVGDTDIQTFSSDMRVAPEGIRSDNLNVVVPSIGAMTGNGTISPDHKLDFKMIAHLGRQSSSAAQPLAKAAAGGGIPFKVEGTTSNPQIIPDVGGIVGGYANGLKNGAIPSGSKDVGQTVDKLGGLLGRKKSQ